ncbi:MAG: isoprenyl transferase [bacterium]|nr:isoprenyl transferase [bacterium]
MTIKENAEAGSLLQEIYKEAGLDFLNIPKHIAIIMDGNGRWAKKRLMPRSLGHREGAEALRRTLKSCVEFGIHYLSVYVFSTENWKRPRKEIAFLMAFLKDIIINEIQEIDKEGVCVRCLGDLSALDDNLQKLIREAEAKTRDNDILQMNLMLNYGSRDEIVKACRHIAEDVVEKKIDSIDDINEDLLSGYLFTNGIPDPDIYIRTGGDYRMSNYLLWQSAYSELFFIDTLWPDFNRAELINVIKMFQKRDRRFGGLV